MRYDYSVKLDRISGKVTITDQPFQTKYVEVPRDERFRKLYSYILVKMDLENACKYLDRAIEEKDETIREGLFRSAVVLYAKCFLPAKNGGRAQLTATDIYAGVPDEPIECHEKFMYMRHKHIAHDEMDYKDAQIGIVLNVDEKKKLGMACPHLQSKFDYDASIKILYKLCTIAYEKTDIKISEQLDMADSYFDGKTYEELDSYPEVYIQVESRVMTI